MNDPYPVKKPIDPYWEVKITDINDPKYQKWVEEQKKKRFV